MHACNYYHKQSAHQKRPFRPLEFPEATEWLRRQSHADAPSKPPQMQSPASPPLQKLVTHSVFVGHSQTANQQGIETYAKLLSHDLIRGVVVLPAERPFPV